MTKDIPESLASAHAGRSVLMYCQRRGVKTYSTRNPMIFSVERKLMQPWLYTQNPLHQTGYHYNSALRDQRTWYTPRTVDFVYWGRELGMASNLHRHMRTAFDFNDSVLPTRVPGTDKYSRPEKVPREHADSLSSSFRPYETEYNTAYHQQRLYRTFPNQPVHTFPVTFKQYHDRLGYVSNKSTGSFEDFGIGDLPEIFRNEKSCKQVHDNLLPHKTTFIPGVDAPFLGEPDTKNMQSLAKALNPQQTVCANYGMYSAVLYINTPTHNNKLDTNTAKSLGHQVDAHSNMVLKKSTLLQAAQCGVTDVFCDGLDLKYLARTLKKYASCSAAEQEKHSSLVCRPNTKTRGPSSASDFLYLADRHLRSHTQLLWRVFSAKRPLLTVINGKCSNSGVGVALLGKYPILRESTEFAFGGCEVGITPFGGALHFLTRKETSNKYPGLAEFALLSGASLYSGDALRLGWSDLYSPLANIDYHFKEWFENSEHIHNDAVTWQLGYFVDELLMRSNKEAAPSMERVAITEVRARWISEMFANQEDLEGIMHSLSFVERLSLDDVNNTSDDILGCPFTTNVQSAVHELQKSRLSYTMMPHELTPLPDDVPTPKGPVHQAFSNFYFERDSISGQTVAHLCDPVFDKWKAFRQRELKAFAKAQLSSLMRHVFVRCECTNERFSFDHHFVFHGSDAQNESLTIEALVEKAQEHVSLGDRAVRVGWCTPQCGIAEIRNDKELLTVLMNDPGLEDPAAKLAHPPIYLLFQPMKLYFSEWAHSVKHILLSQSPFALKCTLRMIQKARGDGSEDAIMSLSDTLEMERRVLLRLLKRDDFHKIGAYTRFGDYDSNDKDRAFDPAAEKLRTDAVFDVWPEGKDFDGHTFYRRPKWNPPTIADVSLVDVEKAFQKLAFKPDGICEVDIATDTFSKKAVLDSMTDAGIQVVSRLGDASNPNTPSNAYVPNNVNFYEMARHPWENYKSSWRLDGYTDGSMKYLKENYDHAERYLYGGPNEKRNYWQSSPGERMERTLESNRVAKNISELEKGPDVRNANLLKENFWNVISGAERNVEPWMKNLKEQSRKQKFEYRKELARPSEKVYDDYYYQWFINPGTHPNPSLIKRD